MIKQWIEWGVPYFQTPAGGKQQVVSLKTGIDFIHMLFFETYKFESRSSKAMPDLWLNEMVEIKMIKCSATFICATLGMVLQLFFLGASKHAAIWNG